MVNSIFQCCMGAIKDGDETSKLFSRCWKSKLSPLCWRLPVLIWSVCMITWTMSSLPGNRAKFFIYMTHWGLIMVFLESLFGIIVTVRKPMETKADATFGLPWYVKTYWVLYNVTIPLAFLISTFYWGLLKTSGKMTYYNPHPVLDVMLHGTNSLVTLVELVMSAHPSRLIHIFQPLLFSLVYLIFNVTYYYAGGLDPFGHTYIYPVMDWSKPQEAMVVVALTGVFLSACHLIVVAIATLRDTLARRCLKENVGICNEGFAA
ncbi:protein rolling stone-like isoform X2 [Plodia interpunctella]|uniref:protein rolling stone-like isoform X2 n=1 Tax=Plodia interpunctella TaxID=58824 RepID=UPI0023680B13|nr:protein rolling stone-like isoform X2 [Plodia interpunctella]XP_053613800.1 protein rolling stone-like isoform X2 [Plodia interpunctella]